MLLFHAFLSRKTWSHGVCHDRVQGSKLGLGPAPVLHTSSSDAPTCPPSQKQALSKKRARKQEPPDPDDSDDARVEGHLEGEEVHLRCQLPHCDYEQVCQVIDGRLTFLEYYCPRDGHFLVCLSRPRVR